MRLLPKGNDFGPGPYLWLVYITPYIVFMITRDPGPEALAFQIAILVVFFILYFRGFWVSSTAVYPSMIGLTGLGVVGCLVNPGSITFFTYAAAFLYEIEPKRKAFLILAVILAITGATCLFMNWPLFVVLIAMLTTVIVSVPNMYYGERRRLSSQLLRAQQEVEEWAKIAERERIARDLHDLLGHTLSLVVLKAQLAGKLIGRDPEKAKSEIADLEQVAREALTQVREVVGDYRSHGLREECLHAERACRAADIQLQIDPPPQLPPQVDRTSAWVLREAMTNLLRHSGAGACRVHFSLEPDQPLMVIEDNGRGLEGTAEGNGLKGMRERLAEIGAGLSLHSEKGLRLEVGQPDHQATPDPL